MEKYSLPFIYRDDDHDLSDILNEDVMDAAIERIKRDVTDESNSFGKVNKEIEYLSYPASRILVSIFDDRRIVSKYIEGEAEEAMEIIEDNEDGWEDIIEEIGISVDWVEDFDDCRKKEAFSKRIDDKYEFLCNHPVVENLKDESLYRKNRYTDLYFADYKLKRKMLKMKLEDFTRVSTMERVRDWKTHNYPVKDGMIYLPFSDVRDFVHELILISISENLPIEVPEEIEEDVRSRGYIETLDEELPEESLSYEIDEVREGLFPPVMKSIINDIREGVNLDHMIRFSAASFLIEIGMTDDEIVDTFEVNDHFAEEPTRYQLDQMRKEGYVPPTYSTIESFGYEWEKDALEQKVKHPLTYYRIKLQEAEENEEEEEENETTNKEEN